MDTFVTASPAEGNITAVSFHVVDATQAVAGGIPIHDRTTYNKDGTPRVGGLADGAMAPSDRSTLCTTCKNPAETCTGHPGVISLPLTVYHPLFMKDTVRVVGALCVMCNRLLLSGTHIRRRAFEGGAGEGMHPAKRMRAMLAACHKLRMCERCGAPQPVKYAVHHFNIQRVWDDRRIEQLGAFLQGQLRAEHGEALQDPDDAAAQSDVRAAMDTQRALTRVFNAGDAADMLDAMHPDDLALLGAADGSLQRLTTRFVSVLTPKETPTMTKAEGSRTHSQDDLRAVYSQILKTAQTIAQRAAKNQARIAAAERQIPEDFKREREEDALLQWADGAPRDTMRAMQEGVLHVPGDVCAVLHAVMAKECYELQQAVATLLTTDAMSEQDRQRSRRIPNHISERLKGKGGRMRKDICGVRVGHAGRAVITPGSFLDIDQVGVPTAMARVFTVRERVHARNLPRLRAAVLRGADVLHGATHVYTAAGRTFHLRGLNDATRRQIRLRAGDVVARHLVNGDWVLMNRQPTLHRASIMAMRVVLIPGESLKFRVTCTPPFNADFDGDEMNIHILQTVEAQAEAQTLMSVPNNITSPQHGGVNIFPVQDEMLGLRELSRQTTWLDRDAVADMWSTLRDPGATPLPVADAAAPDGTPRWAGPTVLSALLPRGISVQHDGMCISDGRIAPGSKPWHRGHVTHLIARSCIQLGNAATGRWLSDLTRAASKWLAMYGGASIGPRDTAVSAPVYAAAKENVAAVVAAVSAAAASLGPSGVGALRPMEADDGERRVLQALGTCTDLAYRVLQRDLTEESNVMMRVIAARSKGSKLNATQLIACLGQQIVKGGRPGPRGAHCRVLPHFKVGETHPAARGFVGRSFVEGLSPTEFFFHMMGALEGLVDTAVSTMDVGYTQRRLGQGMNAHIGLPGGRVGTYRGVTVEAMYGGDGLEPQRLLTVPTPHLAPGAPLDGLPAEGRRVVEELRAATACPAARRPVDTLRAPMDVQAWWRHALCAAPQPHASLPTGDPCAARLSKFEAAAALAKRVLALESDAPSVTGRADDDATSACVWDIAARELRAGLDARLAVVRYGTAGQLDRRRLPAWEG